MAPLDLQTVPTAWMAVRALGQCPPPMTVIRASRVAPVVLSSLGPVVACARVVSPVLLLQARRLLRMTCLPLLRRTSCSHPSAFPTVLSRTPRVAALPTRLVSLHCT